MFLDIIKCLIMSDNNRLLWADSLKGILMVLVVLGHAIQEVLKQGCFDSHVWCLIYSFHMPAFMAISGFVSFHKGGGAKFSTIVRRFQQLIIPFIIWALIRLVINPPYTIKALGNVFLYPDGSFWFLWVLFFITVLFVFGDWISERFKVKQELVIGTLCVGLVTLMVFVEIRILGFQFISYYFLFYTMGYYLHKYNRLVSHNSILLIVLGVIWFVMGWFWNMHNLPVFLSSFPLPQSFMQYSYRFLTAVVAIYVLFGVSSNVLDNNKKWNLPMLELGKISLGIYTSHMIIMPFIVKGISAITKNTMLIITGAFVVSLVVSWVLVWLLSKWRFTSRLLLGKI